MNEGLNGEQPKIIILPEPREEEWDTNSPRRERKTRLIPRPEDEEKLDDDIMEFLKNK
jgi:hypothetical protein